MSNGLIFLNTRRNTGKECFQIDLELTEKSAKNTQR